MSVDNAVENRDFNTQDYRYAPSGVGPFADEWSDKPHRLIYDLCAEIERLQATATRFRREATLVERTEKTTLIQWPNAEVDAFIDAFPIAEDEEARKHPRSLAAIEAGIEKARQALAGGDDAFMRYIADV